MLLCLECITKAKRIEADVNVPREEWPFTEVLGDEFDRSLETVKVYTAEIIPQQTNLILK